MNRGKTTWTQTLTQMRDNGNLNNSYNNNSYFTSSPYFPPNQNNNNNNNNRGSNKSTYFRGSRNFKAKGRGGIQQQHPQNGSNSSRGGWKRRRGKGRFHKGLAKNPAKYNLQDLQEQQQQQEREEMCSEFELINELTDLPGFDSNAGQAYIYPTNKPIRDYQVNIVKTCLYNNTFVCLPTGLGKTFIAAVIMFNFHRWYPNDKIVFMAPNKPLVSQQFEACLNTVGIPFSATIELTGHTPPKKREQLWNSDEKKVFFLTPHVLQNDVEKGICQATQIRCVVIDEAHKSTGKYASSVAIREVAKVNKQFRVLALSATPGANFKAIKEVMHNLLISKLEARSEESPDVLPYIHGREVETKVVPLGKGFFNAICIRFQKQYEVYVTKLSKMNAIPRKYLSFASNLTPNQVREAWNEYRRTGAKWTLSYQRPAISLLYKVCTKLSHALNRLKIYGFRSFYVSLHDVIHVNKKEDEDVALELKKNPDFEKMLSSVQKQLNILPNNSVFTLDDDEEDDADVNPSKSDNTDYTQSHPKMKLVYDIIQEHFNEMKSNNKSSRAMIFSQFRDSVEEIGCMLKSLRPLVKPMIFIGQSKSKNADTDYRKKGMTQLEQQEVLENFKEGEFNVLVSTCVGEEGLDIGDVDLIICYDTSNCIRLVQRIGRTGRKRDGKVIVLLTEGYEEQLYKYSVRMQKANANKILDENGINSYLYSTSPRMVPKGLDPPCYQMDLSPSNPCPLLNSDADYSYDYCTGDENDDDEYNDDSDFEPLPLKSQMKKSTSNDTENIASISRSTSKLNSTSSMGKSLEDLSEISNDSSSVFQDEDETSPSVLLGGKSRCMDIEKAMAIADFKKKKKKKNEMKVYCEIFDATPGNQIAEKKIKNLNSSSIDKLDGLWKEEFNTIPESELLLDHFELLCIREKVDACHLDDFCLEADDSIGFFDGSTCMDTSPSICEENDQYFSSVSSIQNSTERKSYDSPAVSTLRTKPHNNHSSYFSTPVTIASRHPRSCQPKTLFKPSTSETINDQNKFQQSHQVPKTIKCNFNIDFESESQPIEDDNDMKPKTDDMEQLFSDDEDFDYDAIPDFLE